MPFRRLPLVKREVDDPSIEHAWFAPNRGESALAPLHVRVVSWNIALGIRLSAVNRHLSSAKNLKRADVLALQEVSRTRRTSQARTLAAELKMNYVYAGAHRCQLARERGQAILSPHPILRAWRIVLPRVRHPRIALAADIQIGPDVVRVVNVHLENRTRINPFIIKRRAAQMSFLLDWLETAGHARTILAGDLNTLGFIVDRGRSEILTEMLEAAGYSDAHPGETRSTHRPLWSRLDYIFTRHARTVRGAIENTGRLSDHFAVWADVELLEHIA